MDTRAPHDLVLESDLRKLQREERKYFVPVPARDIDRVRAMNEEQRAAYLAENPIDALRLERAREKRARRAGRTP